MISGRPGLPLGLALVICCANCAKVSGADGADDDASVSADVWKCSADGTGLAVDVTAFAVSQYAITWRSPEFGETVCNGVIHHWRHAARGSPAFYWGLGDRHTAGAFPIDGPFTKTTTDGYKAVVKTPLEWPGPGNHVHLIARSQHDGTLVLDPFFEYELAGLQ